MRPIFLNSMSRNGTSYLFQLLAGHQDLFLYPARVLIGCARPRGWPFFGAWEMDLDEFVSRLADRHIVYLPDSGGVLRSHKIMESTQIEADRLRAEVALRARLLGRRVDDAGAAVFFSLFAESLIASYGSGAEASYHRSRFTVFQDDHLFNLGSRPLARHYPDAFVIQTIRNLHDVVASRKKLLLYLAGFRGDPRSVRMSQDALKAESIRWVWSVIAAHLNASTLPDRALLLSFERVKRDTERQMRWLCDRIGIDFCPSLLIEKASADGVLAKNSLLEVRSTLGQLTGGRQVGVVDTYLQTLSEQELRTAEVIHEGLDPMVAEADGGDMPVAVADFVARNRSFIESREPLARWYDYYRDGLHDRLLEEYSGYNFGLPELGRAFPDWITTRPAGGTTCS